MGKGEGASRGVCSDPLLVSPTFQINVQENPETLTFFNPQPPLKNIKILTLPPPLAHVWKTILLLPPSCLILKT